MATNKVVLVGNIGTVPEKRMAGETPVISFTLATTDRGYTTKAGKEVPERTEWHNIVAFGHTANFIEKAASKGDKVFIGGKIRYESYEKEGIKRYITKIVCDEFEPMIKPKNQTSDQPAQYAKPGNPAPTEPEPIGPTEDLPF